MMKKLLLSTFWISTSLWVGGLVILSFLVAPVLFKSLGSRSQAGQAFGAILRAFSWVELPCAIVALLSAAGLLWQSEARLWTQWAQIGVLLLMTVLAGFHDGYVLPAAHELRRSITHFDAEPATTEEKAARERFERLHRLSVSIYGVNIVLGLILVAGSAMLPEFACKARSGG